MHQTGQHRAQSIQPSDMHTVGIHHVSYWNLSNLTGKVNGHSGNVQTGRDHEWVRSQKRSGPAHLCCSACTYDGFLLLSLANSGQRTAWGKGLSSWLSHRCLERQLGQCSSWNSTCAARCQRQATAIYGGLRMMNDRVLLVDHRVELQSLLSLLGIKSIKSNMTLIMVDKPQPR